MSDWTTTRIGDLLRPSNERSISNDQYPVLTSSRSGLHLQSEYFNRVVASKDNTGYKVIRNGQFTYRAMSDDGFFRFNRLTEHEAGIISPAYEVFECNTESADPAYMDYLLNSGIVLSQIYGAAQGGTRLSLRLSTLSEFEAAVPPLPEQKKIAEILSGIDKQITNKTKEVEKHQFLISGILNQLMTSGTTNRMVVETEAGRVPENWIVGKVEDFFELGRGRVISIPYIKENPGPYPVFSSQSKNNGEMGRMNSYDFDGDYFTWTTDGAYAGSVFARSGKFNCTNVCGTGRAKSSSDADTRFAAYFLQRVAKRHVSYVGNPKLMNNVFAAIPFALPPIGEQREIAKIIDAQKSGAALLERQIASLSNLKSSIASDLLSGRKRVSV